MKKCPQIFINKDINVLIEVLVVFYQKEKKRKKKKEVKEKTFHWMWQLLFVKFF